MKALAEVFNECVFFLSTCVYIYKYICIYRETATLLSESNLNEDIDLVGNIANMTREFHTSEHRSRFWELSIKRFKQGFW